MSGSGTSDDHPDHREEKDAPDSGTTMVGRNGRNDRIDGDARLGQAVSLDSQTPVQDHLSGADAVTAAGSRAPHSTSAAQDMGENDATDVDVDDAVEAVIYTELMRASGEAHAVDPQSGSAEDDRDRTGGSIGAPRAVEARDVRDVQRSVERPNVPPADHHRNENPGFFTSLARFLGLSKDD